MAYGEAVVALATLEQRVVVDTRWKAAPPHSKTEKIASEQQRWVDRCRRVHAILCRYLAIT
jgi:hypothetical protein